jgi:hypothetical protein
LALHADQATRDAIVLTSGKDKAEVLECCWKAEGDTMFSSMHRWFEVAAVREGARAGRPFHGHVA